MVFSSLTFLCIFLPIVVILYGIFPVKWRNFLLLAASLVFYAWGEPRYILIMLFSTVFDYINGRLIEYFDMQQKQKAKKRVVMVSIVGNLGILAFFKYTDMLIESFPPKDCIADRYFLLYVSDNVLYDRCVSRTRQSTA